MVLLSSFSMMLISIASALLARVSVFLLVEISRVYVWFALWSYKVLCVCVRPCIICGYALVATQGSEIY